MIAYNFEAFQWESPGLTWKQMQIPVLEAVRKWKFREVAGSQSLCPPSLICKTANTHD